MPAPHHDRASVSDDDLRQALNLALGYLRSGRPQLAEFVCQQALEKSPDNVDAMHLLGIAALQVGHADAGVAWLERAARLAPNRADVHNDLGEALRARGEDEAAMGHYRAALAAVPDFPESHNNLAVMLHQRGELEAALAHYDAALAARPDYLDARYNRALVLQALGQEADAAAELEQVLRAAADHPGARAKLAHLLRELGRPEEAVAQWREVIARDPDAFEAWYQLGSLLYQIKDFPAALEAYRRATQLKPDHVWARFNLGVTLDNLGDAEAALAELQAADRLAPNNIGILNRMAMVLRTLVRLDEAEVLLQRVLALKPDDYHALITLGLVQLSRRSWGAASATFMAAAEAAPERALPMINMACMYGLKGDQVARRHYFGRAVELAPDDAQIRFSYAIAQLLLGEWEAGWRNNPYRPNIVRNDPSYFRTEPLPRDLTGKRVMVQMDQGLGDELMFLRFAPVLKARGAWIAYRPNPKLASFVARLPFVDQAVSHNEAPDNIDYRVAVCDLALAVDMRTDADMPPPVRLTPSAGALNQARQLLGAATGGAPFIGVTWRGGTAKEDFSQWNVLFKEIDLEQLAALLRDIPGEVLILQRKPKPGEVERFAQALGRPVHDLSAINEKLEVMLALLSLIDEYVAVSNTNVHLRAGAGRTSRVLIPHPPDWRWMTAGSPVWYPDMPTYREDCERNWQPALAALHADLVASHGQRHNEGDPR